MIVDVLSPDVNGIVSKKFARAEITKYVRDSTLNGYVPLDGVQYGVYNGYAEEWAEYFMNEIETASAFRSTLYITVNDVLKVGLFALNPVKVKRAAIDLLNPRNNIIVALEQYTREILKNGRIKL